MTKKIISDKKVLRILPYAISLLATLLIYQLHMTKNVDSMLNENNTELSKVFLKSQINYHKEFSPFARRPLTTNMIETASYALGVSLGEAFFLVNFFLMFLSGFLLFILSQKLADNYLHGILNMVVYFGSFSILFAFFPPIFTYDEPLQYCLLFVGLIALVQQRWVWYVLFFTLAMIARESSGFLILGLALFLPRQEPTPGKSFIRVYGQQFFVLVLPIALYAVFITLFLWKNNLWETTASEITGRFSCFRENFKNWQNSVETIVSIFLVLGPFVYFLLVYLKRNTPNPLEKKFIMAFWVTAVINTIIVITATFAREARLFALPLFFIWPLFGHLFSRELKILFSGRLYSQFFRQWKYAILFLLLIAINYLISFKIYVPSFNASDNYYNEYLFLMLMVIGTHFLLKGFAARNQSPKDVRAGFTTSLKTRLPK